MAEFNFRTISKAFKTRSKAGHDSYRIWINNEEFLSNLEAGKTKIAIDILVNKKGFPSISYGKKGNKSWEAVNYRTWAIEPKEK